MVRGQFKSQHYLIQLFAREPGATSSLTEIILRYQEQFAEN